MTTVTEQAIPILRVRNALRAVGWYERLGFAKQWEHRFEPAFPAFLEIARGDVRIFLSEHEGDAQSASLVYLWVNDVDAVAAEFGGQVTETSWAREIELSDPDDNRLRVATPLN